MITRNTLAVVTMCVAAAWPFGRLSAQVQLSAEELVQAARKSPHFKAEFASAQIQQRGLSRVRMDNGAELDLLAYLRASNLAANARIQPLFSRTDIAARYLRTPPAYRESVIQMSDRLVVSRQLAIRLKPGVCREPGVPEAVLRHCFLPKPGGMSQETREILAKARDVLRRAPPNQQVTEGVTAAQALKMDDAQLLDLMLNYSSERETHAVSVVPLRLQSSQVLQGVRLWEQRGTEIGAPLPFIAPAATPKAARLVPLPGRMERVPMPPVAEMRPVEGMAVAWPTRYLLTGYSFGRQIDEAWEHTFAKKSWWHDRYYVRLSYHVAAAFGIRFPLSLSVKSSASQAGAEQSVSLAVAPVDAPANGDPVYSAVRLPQEKYFKGKEFVFDFGASATLMASIPGPNVSYKFVMVPGYTKQTDLLPPLAGQRATMAEEWFPGEATGLSLSVLVGKAAIDLGVAADVTNGKYTLQLAPLDGTSLSGLPPGEVGFSSSQPVQFKVARAGSGPYGFMVSQARYHGNLVIVPQARARVGIDLGIYEWKDTIGPLRLDSLAFGMDFELPPHEGTINTLPYQF